MYIAHSLERVTENQDNNFDSVNVIKYYNIKVNK